MAVKTRDKSKIPGLALTLALSLTAWGQTEGPLGYSIATPRPISPAEGTTTPNAQATQRQNPYLGSVSSRNTGTQIDLSLKSAIDRGLRYNLGIVESSQASADVRADRMRALAAVLPQLSAEAQQGYDNISFKEIGLKLPPIPGLPPLRANDGRIWIPGCARHLRAVRL